MSVETSHVAHNYEPLDVEIASAEGVWVTDTDGKEYLDCLAGYSALNFGHRNPYLIDAANKQLDRLTLTARAFNNDQLEPFAAELAELTGKDKILPMNSGAEAVESALKVARKWGYETKNIPDGQANIVVASQNFHGRTIAISGFSSDPDTYNNFGPYPDGFRQAEYGDIDNLRNVIDEHTAAVMFEPIQGEAGVVVPPEGYMKEVRELCDDENILFIADEIQSGLGRTGKTFAMEHELVVPDMYILGKALGGGIMPVSAVAANSEIMDVLRPGEHGSTFGGNPLASAVGRAVVTLLKSGEYQKRAEVRGAQLHEGLNELVGHGVTAVRGRGLWAGIDIDPALMDGHEACEQLAMRQVLAKDTHGSTIRFSPPLSISERDVDFSLSALRGVLGVDREA